MINHISIGTDIEKILRFEDKSQEILDKIFTKKEQDYCFKSKKYAQHLCARFCAKEAVIKALSDFEINDVYYSDIEILKRENGSPYVVLEKYPNLTIKISLSHCKTYATATVIILGDNR